MLFVSLLQGLGMFPGRRAEPSAVAPEPPSPVSAVSSGEAPLTNQGIKRSVPSRAHSVAADVADKVAVSPTRVRRTSVKKSADPVVKAVPEVASAASKAVASKTRAAAKPASPVTTAAAKPATKKSPPKPSAEAPVVAKPAVKSKALAATPPAKKVTASKSTAPKVGSVVLVVSADPPKTRRGGRKAAAQALPTPQPAPSHAPDAAKATFSHSSERVMTFPVHSPARKDPKLANNWKDKPVDQLTDEEVLSMPDGEYMNTAQLAFFRHKLVGLKNDILTNAGETTEHLREDTVVVPDPADRATIEEEHALELRTRDRERKLLKKIEQSIVRIDGGDYGYCDETGEAIGVGRLLARPTASLSLEAQQRRELKQKMFGD